MPEGFKISRCKFHCSPLWIRQAMYTLLLHSTLLDAPAMVLSPLAACGLEHSLNEPLLQDHFCRMDSLWPRSIFTGRLEARLNIESLGELAEIPAILRLGSKVLDQGPHVLVWWCNSRSDR